MYFDQNSILEFALSNNGYGFTPWDIAMQKAAIIGNFFKNANLPMREKRGEKEQGNTQKARKYTKRCG